MKISNKYNNVRKWLIDKERYEDVIKFDKSDKVKERFYSEMTGYSANSNTANTDIVSLKYKIEALQFTIKSKEDIIKTKDLTIDIQDKIIKALQEKLESK
ncbi:MAG: hypothetical protein ACK5KL_13120 [Dysgonomonas sp.]